MIKVSVEEASRNLNALLELVAMGKEILLLRQDKVVARLAPPETKKHWLVSTREFRESLQVKGEPLSATVIKARGEERH